MAWGYGTTVSDASAYEGPGTDSAGAAAGGNTSVLNVAPTTSSGVYKVGSGLWDKTNVATAATSEELYPGRRAMVAKLGYGSQAYKDWDAQTRALMGVKQGDKFSSGQWIETFGGGSTSGQNAAEADYLSPATKMGMNKFNQDVSSIMSGVSVSKALSGMKQFYLEDETQASEFKIEPSAYFDVTGTDNPIWGGLTGMQDLASAASLSDRFRPGGSPNIKYVEQTDAFFGTPPMSQLGVSNVDNPFASGSSSLEEDPYSAAGKPTMQYEHQAVPGNEAGYFDQLAEKYSGWRSPVGGWRGPDENKTFSSQTGHTFDYREPYKARLPTGNLLTEMPPGTWDQGKFLLTGVQSEFDKPEDLYIGSSQITHSFIPETLAGEYMPQGGYKISAIDGAVKNVKDLITINKTYAEKRAKRGEAPWATEQHEKIHLVDQIIMSNAGLWDDVQFINPNPSSTGQGHPGWGNTNPNAYALDEMTNPNKIYRMNPDDAFVKLDTMTTHPTLPAQMRLIDVIAPVTDFRWDEDAGKFVMNRTIDRSLLHAAIYSVDPNNKATGFVHDVWEEFENHPFFKDIEDDESLKWSEKKDAAFVRAQALAMALNNASINVLSADPDAIQRYTYNPPGMQWSSHQ